MQEIKKGVSILIMRIDSNPNLPALPAIDINILAKNNDSLQKSMEALSSGLRVNLSSDDAELAISEKMRSQIAGYDVAIRNSQDGISMLRTAEGALLNADSFLQRMRELSVQASNDNLTSQDRNFIQEEINNLCAQINTISQTTQFNKRNLLDGSTGILLSSDNLNLKTFSTLTGGTENISNIPIEKNYKIEITSNSGAAQIFQSSVIKGIFTGEFVDKIIYNDDDGEKETLQIIAENENSLRDIENFYNSDGTFIFEQPKLLNITQGDGKSAEVMIYGDETLRDLTNKINDAIANKLGQAEYTNDAEHFAAILDDTENTRESIYDEKGNITGYNINSSIVIQSAISGKTGELHFTGDDDLMLALGLNSVQYSRENMHNDAYTSIQLGDMSANSLGLDGVNILTRESAIRSTGIIDSAIDKIVKERTKIVSCEKVLENTLSSLAILSTNLVDTNSKLNDSDTAKSVLRYVEFQILSHPETAVITQANQNPQSVLNLFNSESINHNE